MGGLFQVSLTASDSDAELGRLPALFPLLFGGLVFSDSRPLHPPGHPVAAQLTGTCVLVLAEPSCVSARPASGPWVLPCLSLVGLRGPARHSVSVGVWPGSGWHPSFPALGTRASDTTRPTRCYRGPVSTGILKCWGATCEAPSMPPWVLTLSACAGVHLRLRNGPRGFDRDPV